MWTLHKDPGENNENEGEFRNHMGTSQSPMSKGKFPWERLTYNWRTGCKKVTENF